MHAHSNSFKRFQLGEVVARLSDTAPHYCFTYMSWNQTLQICSQTKVQISTDLISNSCIEAGFLRLATVMNLSSAAELPLTDL